MYYTLLMEKKNRPRGVMYALSPVFIFYAVNLAVSTAFVFIMSRYHGLDLSTPLSVETAMEYSLSETSAGSMSSYMRTVFPPWT